MSGKKVGVFGIYATRSAVENATDTLVQAGFPVTSAPQDAQGDPSFWYWPQAIVEKRFGSIGQFRIALNAGYEALWLNGVALGADRIATSAACFSQGMASRAARLASLPPSQAIATGLEGSGQK